MASNDSSASSASSSNGFSASSLLSASEAKDVDYSARDTQAVKLRWNYGDAQFHPQIEREDSVLVNFGEVFQKFSNGISASSSSLSNDAKETGISHTDFRSVSGQESQAISGQDSKAISGQDSQAISGQDSKAISGQDNEAVVRLHWNYGDAHFQPNIEKEGLVFVKFYVPHCKTCRATMPLWEKLSETFEGRVTVGEMDCQGDNLKFCERYKVDKYPKLMLFWNGKPLQEYHGKLDFKSLSRFLNRRLDRENNKPFDWRDRYRHFDLRNQEGYDV